MVYNGYEYLAEFIEYHLNLCEHIYIIDHNSERDLRQISIDNVTFIRSNHEAQFQSECTNLVIEHFNIKSKYDWLFVLDIDEFLPFSNKKTLQDFLNNHKNHQIVKLHWKNGVPFYDEEKENPKSLIDCNSIRFFYKSGRQYKSFVNIKKTKGLFFVTTGAHTICRIMPFWRSITPILNRRKTYIPKASNLNLFHIVAFNKSSFVKKIKNYIKQIEYRSHVTQQGGGVVKDYPEEYKGDEWLWYIGNFRVTNPQEFYGVEKENFIENNIFKEVNSKSTINLRQKILSLPKTTKQPQTTEEKKYLEYKTNDRDVLENIKWFKINQNNEIITVSTKE